MELQVNGVKSYAATGGKEFDSSLPTVLFLHGSGMDHRAWALQTRWFAFHGFSVLAPDFPGHSLSAGEPLESIEAMGEWLVDFLAAAGVKKAHVVGHSQGFLSALELAKNVPEKVMSLSGIGTAAAIPVNPALIETAQASAAKAADLMLQWGFGPGAQYGVSAVPGMQPIAIGRQIMSGNPLATDLIACSNYESGSAVAEALDIPTCLVLAGKDRMTPLKAGKALAGLMNAQVTVLPIHGHMLPVEAPKECLQALRDFISSRG
ncbi:alpha/beta fold hydrolase [Leucothrix pacifica]|uniref:Alpha/beta hydrolase n=1 Tax=Leucothrix pacifica TaxID=1247513 RepID=A0A317CA35_9GAMM|nr:alpha/beta hydrolase [Leucothrix pacifica]PWQ95396.1 alpha/beta hydrolase [Leucothrix pacifica]